MATTDGMPMHLFNMCTIFPCVYALAYNITIWQIDPAYKRGRLLLGAGLYSDNQEHIPTHNHISYLIIYFFYLFCNIFLSKVYEDYGE